MQPDPTVACTTDTRCADVHCAVLITSTSFPITAPISTGLTLVGFSSGASGKFIRRIPDALTRVSLFQLDQYG